MPLRSPGNNEHEANSVLLRLGCSADKSDVFDELAGRFNSFGFRIGNHAIDLEVIALESRELVESALQGELKILCPDSVVLVEQIQDSFQQESNSEHSIVEEITIFAISSLVIAMHPDSARRLGYPK